jgi:hypothetical protein
MTVPAWLSWKDLGIHLGLGTVSAALLTWMGTPALASLVELCIIGTVREYSEGWTDFQRANGGPWNGLLDILAWMLGVPLWYGLWLVW